MIKSLGIEYSISLLPERNCFGWNTRGGGEGGIGFQFFFFLNLLTF